MFFRYDEEEDRVVQKPAIYVNPSDETGAQERYHQRIDSFDQPLYKHHVWWLIHNCVAHPLIGMLPSKWSFDFHDWTSKKINGQ